MWNLSMMLIHIVVAMVIGRLFCTAPDKVQKLGMLILIVGEILLVNYYAYGLFISDLPEVYKDLAYKIEHVAILLFVARLLLIEVMKCKSWRQEFSRSPG